MEPFERLNDDIAEYAETQSAIEQEVITGIQTTIAQEFFRAEQPAAFLSWAVRRGTTIAAQCTAFAEARGLRCSTLQPQGSSHDVLLVTSLSPAQHDGLIAEYFQ